MGTDISLCVEQRVATGWALVPTVAGEPWWYEERRYECFSLLTGLDFSARTVRPLEAVAGLRGLPDDLSADARAALLAVSDESTFGWSWLSLTELLAFDWDRTVTWTYMASPPHGVKVTDGVVEDVTAHVRRHGRPPDGWSISGWSRHGFTVVAQVTRRQLAAEFLAVVNALAERAGEVPDAWRVVFQFDR